MNKIVKFFLIWIPILLLIFFFNVGYKAYYSYKVDCGIIPLSEADVLGIYNQSNCEIIIFMNETEDGYDRVYNHEMIHYKQAQRSGLFRVYSCDNPFGVWINEFEAYLFEYFPQEI